MGESFGPGATIGILGGGQLGRMLALAAARLGIRSVIYCPTENSPAFPVAARAIAAAYDDRAALREFADSVDVVTFEFENIPLGTFDLLGSIRPLRPHPRALEIAQDRAAERAFLDGLDIPVAPHLIVASASELAMAVEALGGHVIAKTCRHGYDGKGQARLKSPREAEAAWAALASNAVLAEAMVPFDREISVVLARGSDGKIVAYPPGENVHENGILRSSTSPARISPSVAGRALGYARKISDALDFIGVMAVEMFVVDAGDRLLVNEIAPRVHNSGHWTLDGAVTSQFEQHIRAVCGLPLGAPDALGAVRMDNLIGDEIKNWREILNDPNAHFHDYGKGDAKPGRKMGHVTRVTRG